MFGKSFGVFGSFLTLPLLIQQLADVLLGIAPHVDSILQAGLSIAAALGVSIVAASDSVVKKDRD